MADIEVINPQGVRGKIPEEDAAAAAEQGYVFVTPQDLQAEKLREKYGSGLDQLAAVGTGALSGLTLGLSDIAGAELGGRERLQAYEQLYGTERAAGNIAGTIATAFLGPVAAGLRGGAIARGAATAAAPALAAEALGQRAAQGVGSLIARRLGQEAAEGIGGTAARWAAHGFTESALQGIGQEASRVAISGEDVGEKLGQIATAGLLSGTVGSVFGLGLGAAGGTLRAGGRVVTRAVESVAQDLPAVERALYRTQARLRNLTPEQQATAEILAQPEMAARARTAEARIAEHIEGPMDPGLGRRVSRPGYLQEDITEKVRLASEGDEAIRNLGLKQRVITDSIATDADSVAAQNAGSMQLITDHAVELRRLANDPRIHRSQAETLERLIGFDMDAANVRADSVLGRVQRAIQEGGVDGQAGVFIGVDGYKRELGRIISRIERISTKTLRDIETLDALKPLYEQTRTWLERTQTWGQLGSFQRELNESLVSKLSADTAFQKNWLSSDSFGRDPVNPWRGGKVASAEKLRQNLDASVMPGTKDADRALRDQIAGENAQIRAMQRFGNIDDVPGLADNLRQRLRINERILARYDRAIEDARLGRLLKDVAGPVDSAAAMVAGAAAASISPALVPLAAAIINPRVTMRAAEVVRSMADGQGAAIARSVGTAMRRVRDTSVQVIERLPATGAKIASFEDKSKRVRELSEKRQQIRAGLERDMSWMSNDAANARAKAVDASLRGVDYLDRNIPKGLVAPTPFAPNLPPSKQEVKVWLERFKAVERPMSILDDMAKGKLTPEAVDAVREVYPETFAEIQTKVLEDLFDMRKRGKQPKYFERIQLGLILGIPTDPTMTPEVMRAVQAQYAGATPEERQGQAPAKPLGGNGTKAPDFAGAYRSGAEETELTSGANP